MKLTLNEYDLVVVNNLRTTPIYIIESIEEQHNPDKTRDLVASLKQFYGVGLGDAGFMELSCLRKPNKEQLYYNLKEQMKFLVHNS